jgi:epoxyqueuosine reductase
VATENDRYNAVQTLTEKIRLRALEIGFEKLGIAAVEPLEVESQRLSAWLSNGFHGELTWMERWKEKRVDLREVLPGARSVVAVALNYFTPHDHIENASSGKISRYAWGDDYHDVLKGKLYELLAFIKAELPDANGKVCVDTTPVMDKVWAVRAGLGWIGKSSNLITTDHGSWVFLGELILDVELNYNNEPITDHCGSCTACIEACPTEAIVEPYVVDARKCISYATIELRDEKLFGEFEGKFDGWVYGCDICQDVCPWNRFEKPTDDARFEPRNGETSLDLEFIDELGPESFAARFRRSAMKRTKLSGLQRNAAALRKAGSVEFDRPADLP